jgi:hypothetical protein
LENIKIKIFHSTLTKTQLSLALEIRARDRLTSLTIAQSQREAISRFFIICKNHNGLKHQKYLYRRMVQQAKINTDLDNSKATIKKVTMVILSLLRN